MPKAEKEFVLNYAMNRWQLNFKRNVGPTSDSIRQCGPRTMEEWQSYYYKNVRPKDHIDNLGNELYRHIIEELPQEMRFHPDLLRGITREDCIDYMHNIVINRTFNGYMKEKGND